MQARGLRVMRLLFLKAAHARSRFHRCRGMGMATCFLVGHHTIPEDITDRLDDAIERHITMNAVEEFVVGHYGAFDRLAARLLCHAKRRYPSILLTLLIPYHPGECVIELPKRFDRSFYPPGMETVPRRFAIIRANQYMVRNSDYLICYDRGYVGNTRELVALARRLEQKGQMHVENLADE